MQLKKIPGVLKTLVSYSTLTLVVHDTCYICTYLMHLFPIPRINHLPLHSRINIPGLCLDVLYYFCPFLFELIFCKETVARRTIDFSLLFFVLVCMWLLAAIYDIAPSHPHVFFFSFNPPLSEYRCYFGC